MKWIKLTKHKNGFEVTRVLDGSINAQKYVRKRHSNNTGAIIHQFYGWKSEDGLLFKLYQL